MFPVGVDLKFWGTHLVKTYKNLYPQIYAWDNLEAAYRKARKGKRKFEPVADFEYAWESQLLHLQEELAVLPRCKDADQSFRATHNHWYGRITLTLMNKHPSIHFVTQDACSLAEGV